MLMLARGFNLAREFKMLYKPLLILLLSSPNPAAEDADTSYRITARKAPYFVCDQRVVEDHWLVERFVVPPVRHPKNPLITKDKPWEGTGPHMGGTVLRDPDTGKFMMWYSVWDKRAYENKLPFSYNICYAESDDGIQWKKPSLGVFEYEGSADNNLIKLGEDKTQNIDVSVNPKPDNFPGKFLSIHNQKGGCYLSYSDDGATFQRLFENPVIDYHSDTQNNFVYDDNRDRWLIFCRPRAWAGYHRRRIAQKFSKDFEHWTHERTLLIPTENQIPEYYGMNPFRRGDFFFGVIQIFDKNTGLFHGELAWSGDGEHWDFLPTHPPFITLGMRGKWDAGMVIAAESPVTVGEEWWFYYGGFPLDHNQMTEENIGAIGLMTVGRDRILGMRPRSKEPGTILTRPFPVEGRNLSVNTVIGKGGKLAAELRTDGNKTIEGYSLEDCDAVEASGYAQKILWKGKSLSDSPEEEVRVLFELEGAELYSFDLGD